MVSLRDEACRLAPQRGLIMKIRVQYYGGHHVDFVVPEDILMVDFVEMAKVHGKIRTFEFPE